MKRSKRYKELLTKVPEQPVGLDQAIEILKDFDGAKFDQTIEIHMHLGVDPKQADQIIRGSIVLPHGIGKTQRVVVFAKDAAAEAARAAGADEVGQEELAKKNLSGLNRTLTSEPLGTLTMVKQLLLQRFLQFRLPRVWLRPRNTRTLRRVERFVTRPRPSRLRLLTLSMRRRTVTMLILTAPVTPTL